jgi:hypothetical protein
MKSYSPGQLAELRREQLLADAICYRQRKADRPTIQPRRGVRRPIAALQNWLAAGQL